MSGSGDPKQELVPASEFLALEHRRIESEDKRTEVARAYINANDASDQRQYEYHTERLRLETEGKKETRKAALVLSYIALGVVSLVIIFMFAMLFFGDEEQAGNAKLVLKYAFTGVGGFGIGYFILSVARRLMEKI